LQLPDPTPAQYEMGYFMQWGYKGYAVSPEGTIVKLYDDECPFGPLTPGTPLPDGWVLMEQPRETARSDILEAFRGIGKSYVAAAFALWLLLRDPMDEKILVVSASSGKAREFVSQAKAILMTMD